jgi:subtilisin-like proprotein convertase family protein
LLASIAGTVYHDLDGDGVVDTGDTAQVGWTVYLDGNDNGVIDAGESSLVTGAAGTYSFAGLAIGSYTVREVVQPSWLRTSPAPSATSTGAHGVTITAAGQNVTGRNFLNSIPGLIAGQKIEDTDGDGIRDGGEDGLPDWTIYIDTNDNSVPDARQTIHQSGFLGQAITDVGTIAHGINVASPAIFGLVRDVNVTLNITHTRDADLDVYLISPAGTRVRLFDDVGGVGDDFANTTLDDEAAVAITAGVAPFNGAYRPEQTLSAFDNEKPLGNWRIEVTDDLAGSVGTLESWSLAIVTGDPRSVTDAAGLFSFEHLPPGSWLVREQPQPGWLCTSPPSGRVKIGLSSGEGMQQQYFLNTQPGTIHGYKFHDVDGDGVRDPEDIDGLLGFKIYLDIDDDAVVDSTRTTYASTDVPESIQDHGTVASDINVPALIGRVVDIDVTVNLTHTNDEDLDVVLISPAGTTVKLFDDVGGAGDNFANTMLDDEAAIAITAGAAPFNASYRPEEALRQFDTQRVNGTWRLRVTDDSGVDGLLDGRINGWSLHLTYGDPSMLTSPGYTFVGVPPGSYRLREAPTAGWALTYPAAGFWNVTLLSAGGAARDFMNTPISIREQAPRPVIPGGGYIDAVGGGSAIRLIRQMVEDETFGQTRLGFE